MRSLEVRLYPGDPDRLAEHARGKTVIAIDVFRATTTLTNALANGARQAIPALSPEGALSIKATHHPDSLLGGERDSVLIDGFDLANSPLDYSPEVVAGRTIVFTTTNGTRLLRAVRSAQRVYLGALINVHAVCDAAASTEEDVLVTCAGSYGHVTMEDVLCAGACAERLRPFCAHVDMSAVASEALWKRFGKDPLRHLTACEHGANLIRLDLSADLRFATQVNTTDVVPEMRGDAVRQRLQCGVSP